MRPDDNATPELDKLAAELAQLAPRHVLDRDRLLYAGGKTANAHRYRWAVAGALAIAGLFAASAVVDRALRPENRPQATGNSIASPADGAAPQTKASPPVLSTPWSLLRELLPSDDRGE